MTRNQIDFAAHKENVRHNKVSEAELSRHNVQQEGIGWMDASTKRLVHQETARHNLKDEEVRMIIANQQGTYWDSLGSAAVQNAATNAYNAGLRGEELQEAIRHNLIQEGYDASRAESYAQMAAASIQQAETAEQRRKDEWGHQLLDIGAGAVHDVSSNITSLARSIIQSGGTIQINP